MRRSTSNTSGNTIDLDAATAEVKKSGNTINVQSADARKSGNSDLSSAGTSKSGNTEVSSTAPRKSDNPTVDVSADASQAKDHGLPTLLVSEDQDDLKKTFMPSKKRTLQDIIKRSGLMLMLIRNICSDCQSFNYTMILWYRYIIKTPKRFVKISEPQLVTKTSKCLSTKPKYPTL